MGERGFFGARPAGVDYSSAGIGAWSETVRRGDVPLVLAARGLRAVALAARLGPTGLGVAVGAGAFVAAGLGVAVGSGA